MQKENQHFQETRKRSQLAAVQIVRADSPEYKKSNGDKKNSGN